jgi:arylsulfatase
VQGFFMFFCKLQISHSIFFSYFWRENKIPIVYLESMKKFLSGILVLETACGLTVAAQSESGVSKPNIILIMTDQQRGDALGCMVNKIVQTPNLDRLAADGVVFTNGYSSTPSSTPARAGLLTGMSPWQHGMLGYGQMARKYPYEMPAMLRQLGYYTFGIGKMHWFPQKALHGFHGTLVDESGRVEQDGFVSDYRDWFKLQAPGLDPDKTGIGWNDHSAAPYALPDSLHPTYWTAHTAVELIRNYKQQAPLFLKISFARPHSPYDAPQKYLDRYAGVEIPAPEVGRWAECFAAKGNKQTDAYFGDFGAEFAENSLKNYYANISFLDDMVGEILQALKDKGLYDNSIICFTSDHGDMMGEHHHWRKTYPYEGSAHIPYLFKWNKNYSSAVNKGTKLDYPVELRDFLPTFLTAAGGQIPEKMDGKSLFTLLNTNKPVWRQYIDLEHATCYEKENYWCALTDGKIKYIWNFATGMEQLFDLITDPHEKNDLSAVPREQKNLKLWRERIVQHLSERGDGFVKDGKLVVRTETLLYSPNFPTGAKTISITEWEKEYKGVFSIDN